MNWGGGIDLLRILVNGLTAVPASRTPIHLLLPRDNWKNHLVAQLLNLHGRLTGMGGNKAPRPAARPSESQLRSAFATYGAQVEVRFFDDTHQGLLRSLRDIRADVVFPCMYSLGRRYPVPWIGYILDFQHLQLPHLFSRLNRIYRRHTFDALLREANTLLVNARSVRVDALQFYPDSHAAITSLPFAPSVRNEWLRVDTAGTRLKFGIPERYFIICNQFWVHKDHKTAFRALASLLHALPQAERSVALVCTGSLHDYRAPHHLDELRDLLGQLGIAQSVHLLGHIGKEEQIALLRGAIAVVQPTLFEGGPGGGAIYDAVALGIRGLVSDIPVNREIDDPLVQYFAPGNAEALANLMLEALRQPHPVAADSELLARSAARTRRLGETLHEAVAAALRGPNSRPA